MSCYFLFSVVVNKGKVEVKLAKVTCQQWPDLGDTLSNHGVYSNTKSLGTEGPVFP